MGQRYKAVAMKFKDPVLIVDRPYIQVEHVDGIGLYFSAHADDLKGRLFTADPLEAAAAMVLSRTMAMVNELWVIDFSKFEASTIDVSAALYWLTGGDDAWNNDSYVGAWDELSQEFLDEFGDELYDKTMKCKTMAGLKRMLSKSFSPLRFLEFSLSEKLLRI